MRHPWNRLPPEHRNTLLWAPVWKGFLLPRAEWAVFLALLCFVLPCSELRNWTRSIGWGSSDDTEAEGIYFHFQALHLGES